MIVMYSYLAAMGIAVWFYYRTLIPGLTSWLWPLAVVGCTASYLVSHSGYIVHPEPLARALAWIGNVWILFGFYSLLLMLLNAFKRYFNYTGQNFRCALPFQHTAGRDWACCYKCFHYFRHL